VSGVRPARFVILLGGSGGRVAARGTRAAVQPDAACRRADGLTESDPEAQSRIAAFRKTLQGLGWTEGNATSRWTITGLRATLIARTTLSKGVW